MIVEDVLQIRQRCPAGDGSNSKLLATPPKWPRVARTKYRSKLSLNSTSISMHSCLNVHYPNYGAFFELLGARQSFTSQDAGLYGPYDCIGISVDWQEPAINLSTDLSK